MKDERQVLVIFPHPDDEAFGTSGTLSQFVDNDVPVTYACLTLGQMGRNLGNPPFATRESLPQIRERELDEAASAIGIKDLRKMGYRDKTIEFEPKEELDAMVKSLIDELNPSLIISFYPGYSVHPDHEATAEAVVRTVSNMEKSSRPTLHLVAFSNDAYSDLGEPDVNIDITGYEDRKMKVLQAHASQTGPMLQKLASNTQETEAAKDMWLKTEHFWTYHIE
ncbi:bacillithiol biosynthesis deacetylase BshB2 [Mammaliicoccus stepanovicii]|uniref:Putative LmbE-like protein family protein n=1 Tax=Mammaliicoccus stepanovicii TaxID=643214 RepID=A0A240A952_9STAP|nr:bacillithiol biosynthesis deacetylase BshB2 [Mammaliicoccus stepanovicii]PNZ77155.1 bacillithiol biosynthesis deacetylase BshB2 [Mammaliicoccus stepanovicii]GGI39693.1 bacillithiol biosynthesis deacetylase BshB2 [Mammaliicoccus stepanovicii]SNV79594.1 putative LmbE-like protein family protein [Mammaliicoccus stepanovicii]